MNRSAPNLAEGGVIGSSIVSQIRLQRRHGQRLTTLRRVILGSFI